MLKNFYLRFGRAVGFLPPPPKPRRKRVKHQPSARFLAEREDLTAKIYAISPTDSPFRARPETDKWNRELWKNWQYDVIGEQPD